MPKATSKSLLRPEKLLFAVEASELGLWELNIQDGKGNVDTRWAEMLGYQLDDVEPGMTFWSKIVHPDDKERTLQQLDDYICGKSDSYSAEYRLLRKDGQWNWILDRGKIIEWDNKGKPLVLIGTHKDIQKSKLAEKALIQEKNKLEAVISALGDGLTVQDRNFKIIYQNTIQKERQGAHEGDYCYNAYQGRKEVCDGCLIAKCFADGQVHRRETSSISPDGNELFMEVSASPIRDAEGNIIAGIETVRDITPRKLLEKQLQHSQKLEAIGTLAGGIAHDFNNILAAIFGYAELVQLQLPKESELWAMQEQIITASHRAKKLVQQILAVSRKEEQELEAMQLNSIIEEVSKLLRSSLPSTIEIKESIAPQAGTVLANPTKIHQVLMNLCTNAYHAMQETGGVLSLELQKVYLNENSNKFAGLEIPAGAYVRLTVSDTGHGMDAKTRNRIFDPYFTTKKKEEGTGLGLAVVHGIVKNSGGHITVHSKPTKGTSFIIYLPQADSPDKTQGDHKSDILPAGNERILLVDDEQTLITLEQQTLEGLGYHISVTTSSEKALQMFSSTPNQFDLVISDMTMPIMTGAELSKQLLAIRPDIPIILCTGFSSIIDAEQVNTIGIRTLIMKPVSRKELAKVVREVLDNPAV